MAQHETTLLAKNFDLKIDENQKKIWVLSTSGNIPFAIKLTAVEHQLENNSILL